MTTPPDNPIARIPVEYDVGAEVPTIRGQQLVARRSTGQRLVLLHDLGVDLDQFGSLPVRLARDGFVVDTLDLPGHGLSDGDDPDGDDPDGASVSEWVRAGVVGLVRHITASSGRLGVVAAGSTATVMSAVGEDDGVTAQVVINPVLDDRFPLDRRARSTRLIVQGEHANLVGTRTQQYFSHVLGERLMIFNPLLRDDVAAAGRIDAVAAHVALFFRRYLHGPQRSGLRPDGRSPGIATNSPTRGGSR